VQLVISDQHAGLVKAAMSRCFAGAAHQRCRVHFARNLLAHVPKSHKDMVAACSARSSPNPTPGRARHLGQVRDRARQGFPKIGPLMDDAKAEVLAFTAFPRTHWRKIWSTTPSLS
jgi:putative transposase